MKFKPTPNWSAKKHVADMSPQQKCKWIAFLKAITIIDNKSHALGIDPNTLELPNNQIYRHYIKPESETFEYYLSVVEEDNSRDFFIY